MFPVEHSESNGKPAQHRRRYVLARFTGGEKLCSKCHDAPPVTGQRYCKACHAEAQREHRAKKKAVAARNARIAAAVLAAASEGAP